MIELNTNWQTLCNSLVSFRSDIASKAGISDFLVVVSNAKQGCQNGGTAVGPIKVHVSVLREDGKGETDVKATLQVNKKLEGVKNIGGFQVSTIYSAETNLEVKQIFYLFVFLFLFLNPSFLKKVARIFR